MNYNLVKLKRPIPFANGNMNLWDDSYIANNVLNKHLDYAVDSGSRNINTIYKTVEWITQKYSESTSILDVGCGPGLYADLLAKSGFIYTGIDISPYQIEYARNRNKNIRCVDFYCADFRIYEFLNMYDIVLMLYGIYSFYPYEQRIDFLKKVKRSLNNNGCVIVEVFTPKHYKDREESTDWEFCETCGFWSDSAYLELNSFLRYDEQNLVLVQAVRLNDTISIWNSWIQTFTVDAIIEELKICGFTRFECYDNCTGKAFSDNSDTICICAYVA